MGGGIGVTVVFRNEFSVIPVLLSFESVFQRNTSVFQGNTMLIMEFFLCHHLNFLAFYLV